MSEKLLTGAYCMRRSRNFARGVQARLPENSSQGFFLFSPQPILHFYRGLSMVYFKENYKFTGFQKGSNIFQGGGGGQVQHFPGGSNFFQGGGSKC